MAEQPQLACNQEILSDQILALLAEIEAGENINAHISVNQIGANYRAPRMGPPRRGSTRYQGSYGGNRPYYPPPQPHHLPGPPRTALAATSLQDTCYRCYGAGRRGPQTKTHQARECPYTRTPAPAPMRTVVIMPPGASNQYEAQPMVQQVQLPMATYPGFDEYGYGYQEDQFDYSNNQCRYDGAEQVRGI